MKTFDESELHVKGGVADWSISNFRSIPGGKNAQEIFLAPLTIICGENSSGKSTLLNSILLMQQQFTNRRIATVNSEAVELNGNLVQLGDASNIRFAGSERVRNQDFTTTISYTKNLGSEFGLDNKMKINFQFESGSDNSELLTSHFEIENIEHQIDIKNYQRILDGNESAIKQFTNNLGKVYRNNLIFERNDLSEVERKNNDVSFYDYKVGYTDNGYDLNGWSCKLVKYESEELNFNDLIESDKTNIVRIDPKKINYKQQESIELEGVMFWGGIPDEAFNKLPFAEYIAAKFVEEFKNIIRPENIMDLYDRFSSIDYEAEYENNISDFYDRDPEYGELEVDEEGYINSETDETEEAIYKVEMNPEEISKELLTEFAEIFLLIREENEMFWNFENLYMNTTYSDKTIFNNLAKFNDQQKLDFHTELLTDLLKLVQTDDSSRQTDLDLVIEETFSSFINRYEIFKSLFEQNVKIDDKFYKKLYEEVRTVIEETLNNIEDNLKSNKNFVVYSKLLYGEKAPKDNTSDIDLIIQNALGGLYSVKYIGPLRKLENYEKRENLQGEWSTPIGLNGERFFNYYDEWQHTEKDYLIPNGDLKHCKLSEAFNLWLDFFDLAESFSTKYESKDNNIYAFIKPKMLNAEVRMDSLGVGFSQLAPIILLCLSSEEGSTVLLEQPELHLHPGVQQKFGDFLLTMSKNLQIIVETHSDHFLNRVRRRVAESSDFLEENVAIYFAERIKGKTQFRQAEIDSTGTYLMQDFPQGFFDQGAEDAFVILKSSMLNNQEEDEAPF